MEQRAGEEIDTVKRSTPRKILYTIFVLIAGYLFYSLFVARASFSGFFKFAVAAVVVAVQLEVIDRLSKKKRSRGLDSDDTISGGND